MIDLTVQSSLNELQNLPYWNLGEVITSSESAGESNMNLVLRIKTTQRSLILKQSKPYVRKYPQIPAPINRIEVEHQFLELVAGNDFLAKMSPKVVLFDPKEHILISEDLGKGVDFSGIYSRKRNLDQLEIRHLMRYLNQLHSLEVAHFPANLEMRKLNHEHIFHFPFLEENGFDLDTIQPGLQDISLFYKKDKELKVKLTALGSRYLSQGRALVHGDFYPGSWLDVESGIKVIDPEFGFLGDPEFDLGVLLAHLDLANQPEELKDLVLATYKLRIDLGLVRQFRGVEILRRLVGIAQLPLDLSLSQKNDLLEMARNFVLCN